MLGGYPVLEQMFLQELNVATPNYEASRPEHGIMDRKKSIQMENLLCDLYERSSTARHYSFETESWTDHSSYMSDAPMHGHRQKYSPDALRQFNVHELRILVATLRRQSAELSARLVRQLKRRDHQLSRRQAKDNLMTAILQAMSQKRS